MGVCCPWAEPVDAVLHAFNVESTVGLPAAEAQRRLAANGPNLLNPGVKKSRWELFVEQFDDALVKVLLAAAATSFVLALLQDSSEGEGLREFIEPFVILLILILNATVGVWQESNAEVQFSPGIIIPLNPTMQLTVDSQSLLHQLILFRMLWSR